MSSTSPFWQFWVNWAVQLAIAIGTIAAATLALFGGWIRTKLLPPSLHLSLPNTLGTKSTIVLFDNGTARESVSRWYHVKVENTKRWSPASQTQVLLVALEEPDASGQDRPFWVGSIPLKWRSMGYLHDGRTLGYPAECDLCSVVKDGWFEIHPAVAEFPMKARRSSACNLVMSLQARSVEADSGVLRVRIIWDGQWHDEAEEMSRHLVVRQI